MARTCLGRCARSDGIRARPQPSRQDPRAQRHTEMNDPASAMTIERPQNGAVAASAKIDIRNLDFHYGKGHALKDVSFRIPSNAVTSIIGPSGCGKSTLLRTINRIFELYPDQRATGEIIID